MNQQNYHCSIAAGTTAKDAFKKVSHVNDWWTTSFKGSAEKLNDEFSVRFGETFVDFKVVDITKDQKAVWHVTDCNLHWQDDKKEWKDTQLVWEVAEEKDTTKLEMTHVGLKPGVECFDTCVKGWDFYLKESLAKLLKEGKGLPEGRPK